MLRWKLHTIAFAMRSHSKEASGWRFMSVRRLIQPEIARIKAARAQHPLDAVLETTVPELLPALVGGRQRRRAAIALMRYNIWKPGDVTRICHAVGCFEDSDSVWMRAAKTAFDLNAKIHVTPNEGALALVVLRRSVETYVQRLRRMVGEYGPPHTLLGILTSSPLIPGRKKLTQKILEAWEANGRVLDPWPPKLRPALTQVERNLYIARSHQEAIRYMYDSCPPGEMPRILLSRLACLSFDGALVLSLEHFREFIHLHRDGWRAPNDPHLVSDPAPYLVPSPIASIYLRHAVWQIRKPLLPLWRAIAHHLPNEEERLAATRRQIAIFADGVEAAMPWLGSGHVVYPPLFTLYGLAGAFEDQKRCYNWLKENSDPHLLDINEFRLASNPDIRP
ncbi:hypothetical protein BKA62DRAFT_269175 [Auriculariales sp. MPI-PUGE-AT-0066]|nr:hypothetical protein BKA62DRAFT_269175 [Auriculariales sp. MPI-PUGE-AT-0066]